MKYFVCNLKNKLTKDEIIKYNEVLGNVDTKNTLVVVPSLPYLGYFSKTGYSLGSQDISSFSEKTITGEVTGEQLTSMDVSYVIVGHSERREFKKEINIDFINKIENANSNKLNVIYCVGESLKDRESGNVYNVLEKQISEVLNNVELKNVLIAYEPVWAIGTGVVPKLSEIEDTIQFIKDIVEEKYEHNLRVLYGGSVNLDNIDELNTLDVIDGFLVGGASLNASNVLNMLEKIN